MERSYEAAAYKHPDKEADAETRKNILLITVELESLAHFVSDTDHSIPKEILKRDWEDKWEALVAKAARALNKSIQDRGQDPAVFWNFDSFYDKVLPKVSDPLERAILKYARGIRDIDFD